MSKNIKCYLPKDLDDYFSFLANNSRYLKRKEYKHHKAKYKRFCDEKLPKIWPLILDEFIPKAKYFSVSFPHTSSPYTLGNLTDESVQFLDKMNCTKITEDNLDVKSSDQLFSVTPEFKKYISSSNYHDWLFYHPEDPTLYDSNKDIILQTISHEGLIYFHISEIKKQKLEDIIQIKLSEIEGSSLQK